MKTSHRPEDVPGRLRNGCREPAGEALVSNITGWSTFVNNVVVVLHIFLVFGKEISNMTQRGQNWCFTLNNYTSEDVARLSELVGNNDVRYIVFGREVGENGTPHLQGFVQFSTRKRPSQVSPIISRRAHCEISRNVNASRDYCKKDGDFEEFGVFKEGRRGQGKRSDIELFKDAVKKGESTELELMENHSLVFAKYPQFVQKYMEAKRPRPEIVEHELRGWQSDLNARLEEDPDDRKIFFVVDSVGNSGKTWFAKYFCLKNAGAQYMTPGKKADMAYALMNDLRCLFMDCPRSKQGEFIQYDFLEEVKNRCVFSGKYESRMRFLPLCHIVVLMNETPDMTKLSLDRYEIINLDE